MTPVEERREGMGEVIERLASIETRLSRMEGGLVLAAFITGAVVVPLLAIVVAHAIG